MNPIVEAALAKELATLERVTDAPTGALGYGRDLSCITDCTDNFAEVSGPMLVLESVARSWITPRGTVLDDPDFGTDCRGILNHATPIQDLRMMQSRLQTEALKDERVETAQVRLEMDQLARRISATGTLGLRDWRNTTFTFVLSVTDGETLMTVLQGAT